MTKRYEVTFHPEAGDYLDAIDKFIAEYAGERAADRILGEIEFLISTLADFTKIGTVRDEVVPNLRALPASAKATVCFTSQRRYRGRKHRLRHLCRAGLAKDRR